MITKASYLFLVAWLLAASGNTSFAEETQLLTYDDPLPGALTADNQILEELGPIEPNGLSNVRRPIYRWTCEETADYRIQIRQEAGGVELTSDPRSVDAKDGVCTLPFKMFDQMRLRDGTLPIQKPFEWVVQKVGKPWSEPLPFEIASLATADFEDISSTEWMPFGPGWQTGLGSLTNESITGEDTEYYFLRSRPEDRRRARELQNRKEIAASLSVDCDDSARCKGGILVYSHVNKACRDGDAKGCNNGEAPNELMRIMITNVGHLVIETQTNNAGTKVIYDKLHEEIDVAGKNLLRVAQLNGLYRVVVNGEQLFCGVIKPRFPSGTLVLGGIAWSATGSPLGGLGLEVEELHVIEGSHVKDCWIPLPPPIDGWL